MGLFGGGIGTALGAGVGFAVGGPTGAAFGAGLGGGLDTNADNADRADASNAWSAAQYGSRYQTTVKDLTAAGLNPMLAYSQGAGSAPTAQAVQFQNPVSSASQALSQYAGAEQSFSSASQAQAAVKQIDATVDKIVEETKNLPVQREQIYYTIRLLAEQAEKVIAETGNTKQATAVGVATVKKLKAETSLLDLDVDAAKSLDNIGRESRQLKPIVDIIRAVIK
jgi:hypothetical protein